MESRYSDSVVRAVPMLQKNPKFCKEVDMPINQEKIAQLNVSQTNFFNKIRSLSMVTVRLSSPNDLGVLRLFFSCNQEGNSPTQHQMHVIHQIAKELPQFLHRILAVRSQINSLALSNMDQTQRIRELQSYQSISAALKSYQQKVLADDSASTSVSSLAKFTQSEIESFLRALLENEQVCLKQILWRQPGNKSQLLLEKSSKDLVKFTDHF